MGSATTSEGRPPHVTSVKFAAVEYADLKLIAAHDRRSLSNELRWLVARRAQELRDAEVNLEEAA